MKEVVVYEVPAPALLVTAQQSYVAVALVRSLLGRDPDNRHRAQRPLPYDLPGVPTATEPDFATGSVRALCDRVPVEGEPVGFDVDVTGAVGRVPRVVKGSKLGLNIFKMRP